MASGHERLLALLVLCLITAGWVGATVAWQRRRTPRRGQHRGRRRTLRPRPADDCPACRAGRRAGPAPAGPLCAVPPWRTSTTRRGRPQRVVTEGHACPEPTCPYRGITNAAVHALIGYGHHGTTDRIQDFLCQACGTKVSARRDTALYRLKTPPQRVGEVLSALAEGMSVDAAVRVFGHGEPTLRRWLARAGAHAGRLHQRLCAHLQLPHVQLDEIRTRLRRRTNVLWLWLAVDPCTKIIPVFSLVLSQGGWFDLWHSRWYGKSTTVRPSTDGRGAPGPGGRLALV
jgi:transposase-like protein